MVQPMVVSDQNFPSMIWNYEQFRINGKECFDQMRINQKLLFKKIEFIELMSL